MKNKLEILNIKNILFIILLIFFLEIRVYNLDADIPAWGIVNYQPMDEGQYATMALNKINNNTFRLDVYNGVDFMTSAHIRNNLIGNLSVYLGLVLLGDNYYGLRISSVVWGLLNYFLFALILKNLREKYGNGRNKWSKSLYLAILGIFLIDLVYLVASRTVETSIYRMFFLQLIIFIFTKCNQSSLYEQKVRFLIIGFLSVLSIFAVYITNLFIFLAMLITIVIYGIWNGKKCFFNSLISFAAGAGIAYVLCDMYYNFIWGTSCLVNTMQIISDFSGTSGYTGGNNVAALLGLMVHFFSANSNLYNIGILLGFLLVLPYFIKRIVTTKNINVFFIASTILSLLIQTFINEDYIVRKYIMIYPSIIYLLYYMLISSPFEDVKNFYNKHMVLKTIYSMCCLGLCLMIIMYRLFWNENETYKDFEFMDKSVIIFQILITILVWSIFVLTMYKRSINNRICVSVMVIMIMVLSVFTNAYFDIKYVFNYKSYTEKEAMLAIGEKVGNEYVYGVYSIAFTLYNDIKPVVNTYNVMGEDIEKTNVKWYLDYSDFSFPSEVLGSGKKKWIEKEKYNRNFSTFGTKRDISLYKITKKIYR